MYTFLQAYAKCLESCITAHPENYSYGVDKVPVMVYRFLNAMKDGTYCNDGQAFRDACKVLGIKNTFKAVNAFMAVRKEEDDAITAVIAAKLAN